MSQCPLCGEPLAPFQEACPVCSSREPSADRPESRLSVASGPEATADEDSLVILARFTSAAEAGYFAEELSQQSGIPTLLRSDKNFNALSGYWSQRFDLLVPRDDLSEAEATLRRLIAQTGGGETFTDDCADSLSSQDVSSSPDEQFDAEPPWTDQPPVAGRIHWVPIVLTLTAGTVAFWAARRIHPGADNGRRPAPAELSTAKLWNRLGAAPRPWRQSLPDGRGVRELRFDGQRAVLREDADGDGVFEREEYFERPLSK